MKKLVQTVKQFWNDEAGLTAVEYAILLALIAGAVIVGATALGPVIQTAFTTTSSAISAATN